MFGGGGGGTCGKGNAARALTIDAASETDLAHIVVRNVPCKARRDSQHKQRAASQSVNRTPAQGASRSSRTQLPAYTIQRASGAIEELLARRQSQVARARASVTTIAASYTLTSSGRYHLHIDVEAEVATQIFECQKREN